ncbi:MAG: hypothetical protein QM831_18225 [Kofleriaceae bacterium]
MRVIVVAACSLIACSNDGAPPPDPCIAAGTCAPGVWVDVTPPEMTIPEFGPGPVVADPAHPNEMYVAGGGAGVWKSLDYGNTWTQINTDIPYVPMGLVTAVVDHTVWIAGNKVVFKSIDGGASFAMLPNDLPAELYSLQVDPDDSTHLISGLHEADGIVESHDGGATWSMVTGTGFPTGGISWYPFFIDGSDGWLAIAQDGASVVTTSDGGATWKIPDGISGLQHAHGNAQIFQTGDTILVPGIAGPGQGVYRSDDRGGTFHQVLDGAYSIAWGTQSNAYAMWGWACADCNLGAGFSTSALPGTTSWTKPDVPVDMNIGANHIAVTSDGTHTVFVGTMWSTGIWRYIEP